MKYFTAEIWSGWQADGAAFDRAEKQWKRNRVRYKINLRKIAPRLGAHHGKFFTEHSLHDGRLLAFVITDWPQSKLKAKKMIPETSVRIDVLAGRKTPTIYQLLYTGVKEISVRTKNILFPLNCSRFGDWGYDELLREGRNAFRHNILFQTGTEISVAFERFAFRRRKTSLNQSS